ncbi:phospho-N-acetylmuramoyl-pentapeptide-transferase [Sulfurimonas lithotrophica]|uniref:Phospho-N-acetylmuramoyl-pentapeptide-transferase n=1 Tax=Sulfurimonas lithotrophica TaxID=2590022 RepID=A0A5P8P2G1_9BACT|nr:phospho-N-acetylmuramoyl-pentapeptide-transferase [Sulfurimonas lithotrophica]QFR49811.1 phospho-N-acetylmuramoyl-pentapeptide-transferase [Sulfurimonas lithotrophica]
MLYWLYETFNINLLGYITIRAGVSFFLALFFVLYFMPKFIRWAQKTSSTQPINGWAPERHQAKASTPTMGGIVFISATVLASVLTIDFANLYTIGALLTLILFSLIGFQDDYAKIKKNENLAGLKARTKLLLQIISALVIACFLCLFVNFNTELYIPFIKTPVMDMGSYSIVLWIIVIIAASNAVNLTDGLDGLATVPSITALSSFSIIIYITGHAKISEYLLLPNFQVGEVTIISTALMGALTGFLWHNCHPAEVFMGDSGSLTIGAFLGYLAIISKSEILLLLIGSIFVIETLSVILQVGSYKLRKKRVFLMAPIHHHFEMKNWAENKIIVRFWIISVLSNLIALITLKIR